VIMIGKPLKQSPVFPPFHTVRETFTSHGVPSI
ncbi:glutamine ABC transporter permease, partial [Clostridium neonatale]